jgi:hypothetical protein
MNSDSDTAEQVRGGLPHSEIPGSPIARISPGLFAACHVLHRLSVPSHPPDALNSRLITGLYFKERPHHRRAQGQTPFPAVSHEDTSSDKPCVLVAGPGARPPRSHHKRSLHPSINPPRLPAALVLIFPRAPSAHRAAGGASRRRRLASPVVEVNGVEPMTSCLQSRRSPS